MTFGPFKCPDCNTWWAGFEHRCAKSPPNTNTVTVGPVVTTNCVCWMKSGSWGVVLCPVHDVSRVTVRSSAENPTWGTCVGEAVLCDDGTVKDDPFYTCGYECTGGKHVAPGQYVRCVSPAHGQTLSPAFAGAELREGGDERVRS